MQKTGKELFEEREKRVLDAVHLNVPDRVPIVASGGFLAAKFAGFTCKQAMYDEEKAAEGTLRYLQEFQPDLGDNPFVTLLMGKQLESIGYTCLAWPGHGLDDMSSFQFLEKELMSADEYDSYMYDPTDFVIRKIWPRIFEALKPFEKLPPLQTTTDYVSLGPFGAFGDPDIQKALGAMMNTGKIIQKKVSGAVAFQHKLKELGFPSLIGGGTLAPFDYIGDILRGTKGIMLDMFRMPNKVLDMIEKVYPMMLRNGMMAKTVGKPGVFIPLHKGLDGFMSPDQFKTFYWPTLKRLIEAYIAEDLIPMILWEGDCGSRLEVIGDIPAGKAIYMFERTDMVKAKEILGDVVCLYGNVPISVLVTGTTDDVKAICKRLIDEVGKDGGFIMAPSTNLDDAKPENVKAMIKFTKEYGVYT